MGEPPSSAGATQSIVIEVYSALKLVGAAGALGTTAAIASDDSDESPEPTMLVAAIFQE